MIEFGLDLGYSRVGITTTGEVSGLAGPHAVDAAAVVLAI